MHLRKFDPLPAGHPAVGEPCGICRSPIRAGDETVLIPREPLSQETRTGTVEAALCHWRCLAAAWRRDMCWTAPDTAVPPVNHFHSLYMRLAAISDDLLRRASSREHVLMNPVFGELMGGIAEMSNLAARMTARLEGIRRDFPELWRFWQDALEYEPPRSEVRRE